MQFIVFSNEWPGTKNAFVTVISQITNNILGTLLIEKFNMG